ncbi:LysE family translocator [Lacibacterium aquatile]|uniref:LysE family translocator n=1 Tax=Lacibacterium aquatile TaxID=1168082 RepID=A0ABW5DYC9_9PROT
MSPFLTLFLKGLLIGIAVAAPVGPVAVLCIRRALIGGFAVALATGLGAVIADTIFGSLAAFGVAAVSGLLLDHQNALRVIGGLFMLILGALTWRKTENKEVTDGAGGLIAALLSAFALTITNPITIFAFTGIFAAFDIVSHDMSTAGTAVLAVGIALGCAIWWLGLASIATGLRSWVGTHRNLVWLHHLSGGLLLVFGAGTLASLFFV